VLRSLCPWYLPSLLLLSIIATSWSYKSVLPRGGVAKVIGFTIPTPPDRYLQQPLPRILALERVTKLRRRNVRGQNPPDWLAKNCTWSNWLTNFLRLKQALRFEALCSARMAYSESLKLLRVRDRTRYSSLVHWCQTKKTADDAELRLYARALFVDS